MLFFFRFQRPALSLLSGASRGRVERAAHLGGGRAAPSVRALEGPRWCDESSCSQGTAVELSIENYQKQAGVAAKSGGGEQVRFDGLARVARAKSSRAMPMLRANNGQRALL